jgi:glutaminyl-tRNA synthetase
LPTRESGGRLGRNARRGHISAGTSDGTERMSAVDAVSATEAGRDFIRDIVAADLAAGRVREVVTRFPPEPNGYLHIGHAKSICLNFGVAEEFGGRCHLRFDDTNPTKEEQEYIDAIQRDLRWLGFDWGVHLYHASDYFEQLYAWAEHLIITGHAYVDDLSAEEIRAMRGTLTEPGRNSPYRDRSPAENLDLFRRMRAGEFPNGARVLRAKIDMGSGNINLRDPVLYRILHAAHPRTGTRWCIYPTYDFAHGQSDAIEGVTHSICTLEFEDHRPLYDWLIEHLPVPARPRQYEFARLNLTYTVMSKRFLKKLVDEGHVAGWDDPRMPTLAGLRRRGIPPAAIREFARRVGVARANSTVDVGMFEHAVRDELNRTAPRRMAVLRPLKLVIENYPEGKTEELEALNHPNDESYGKRSILFGRELYIETEDFAEVAPPKFKRLALDGWVRLRYAYLVHCHAVRKNKSNQIVELRCTYNPNTKSGTMTEANQKRTGTIHWVNATESVPAEIRLYNVLFSQPNPAVGEDLMAGLNPDSLELLMDCRAEPALASDNQTEAVQFERQGYFTRDPDSRPGMLVFNRAIELRDRAKLAVGLEAARPKRNVAFPRIEELRALVRNPTSPNAYFHDFERRIAEEPTMRRQFLDLERELQGLDKVAWTYLKREAAAFLERRHPIRGWQALFDTLNQARAYNHLARIGCTNIRFVERSRTRGEKTPDLEATLNGKAYFCEVKTINTSDIEANRRTKGGVGMTSAIVAEEFLGKLYNTLTRAKTQMERYSQSIDSFKLAYLIINFDDILHEYAEDYQRQIEKFLQRKTILGLDIHLDIKPRFYAAMG